MIRHLAPWGVIGVCLGGLIYNPTLYNNPAFASILSMALLAAKIPGDG